MSVKNINIQSFSNVITNSSSEIFIVDNNEKIEEAVRTFYEGIEEVYILDSSEKVLSFVENHLAELNFASEELNYIIDAYYGISYHNEDALKLFSPLLDYYLKGKVYIEVNNNYWEETIQPLEELFGSHYTY